MCAGASTVQTGRLQRSTEGFQTGPELGDGSRDIWTLCLCSSGRNAALFSQLLPSCQRTLQ